MYDTGFRGASGVLMRSPFAPNLSSLADFGSGRSQSAENMEFGMSSRVYWPILIFC